MINKIKQKDIEEALSDGQNIVYFKEILESIR